MKRWQSCNKFYLDFNERYFVAPSRCNFCNDLVIAGGIAGQRARFYCEKCHYMFWYGSRKRLEYNELHAWYQGSALRIYRSFFNKMKVFTTEEYVIQADPIIEISKLLNYIDLYKRISLNKNK